MIVTCVCGQRNRVPDGVKGRCSKCKHVFTIPELIKATPDPVPPRPTAPDPAFLTEEDLDELLEDDEEDDDY